MGTGYASHSRIAHTLWAISGGIFLALFTTTASALECRGKDISGATSFWSESSSEALSAFPINLIDLPEAVIGGITHRMRNNSVSHYRVTLNPGDLSGSWLSLQVAGTFFNVETTRDTENPDSHKKFIRRIAGSAEIRESTRIRDHSRTGWLGAYKPASSDHWCYVAVLAFEPSPWGAGRVDEIYEMIVRMKDCTGRRTHEQLEEWLYSIRAVPEGYNRN